MAEAIQIIEVNKISEVVKCASVKGSTTEWLVFLVIWLTGESEKVKQGLLGPKQLLTERGSARPDSKKALTSPSVRKNLKRWRLTGWKNREVCGVVDTHRISGDSGQGE